MNSNGEGFYITLPNNEGFGNTPWTYTTQLPQWIELKGEWEIGLHSMTYTRWDIGEQLHEALAYRSVNQQDGTPNKNGDRVKNYSTTIQKYVTSLNESLEKKLTNNEIQFTLQNGKVTITLDQGYKVYLRRGQALVLGFITSDDDITETDVKEISKTETGKYLANLHLETNIHVYCDIVQPQIVGNETRPLLGIVPYKKTIETVYVVENIRYMPVQTKSFQQIKVLLRSSTNEPIPFEYGRASITLHLKPLNYF